MELFRLIIKRIKDLLLFSGLITGEEYLIVYDPVTDTSYKVKVSSIRGGQSTLEKWSPDAEYDEGKILEWNLKIWQSLTDNNQGNIPTEGAFWTEVSRSEGGNCGYYAPGVFTNDPTIVLHSGSLYWLDNTVVTLPFNSTDFAAELAANKWKSITGSGGGGLTPEQEEILDDAEAHIDGANEAKHNAEQIYVEGLNKDLEQAIADGDIGETSSRSYSIDFGTGSVTAQEINMFGPATIDNIVVNNVASILLTWSGGLQQEVTPGANNIAVQAADVLTWEIVRTTENELATIGVHLQIT